MRAWRCCAWMVSGWIAYAPSLVAQESVVVDQLERATRELADRGYNQVRPWRFGAFGAGMSDEFTSEFASDTYVVVGFCDNGCTDLDLSLKTIFGELLTEDVAPDDRPILGFQIEAGLYWLEVTMAQCDPSPCHWGVGVYRLGN